MADRQKVIRWLRNCDGHTIFTGHGCEECPYFEDGNINGEECVERLHLDALELLKEQPKIVRCKDCKYCKYPKSENWCEMGHLHGNTETWFCAEGERR